MSKKTSLEALKAAWGKADRSDNSTGSNNYYPFWLMQNDQRAIVRFLPDLDENNSRGFLVEKVFHNLVINGQKKKVPCLTMYGEDCPICKVSQKYYAAKDEENGKKYWRKKQYIAQALVVEDPLPADSETGETHQGKVRYIALGWQLYSIIKEAFAGDDLETIPYDLEDGNDFVIKKSEQGKYSTYNLGSKFKNASRELSEEELAIVDEGSVVLETLLPANPGFDSIQSQLDADLNGSGVAEAEESFSSPAKASRPSRAKSDDDEADDTPRVAKATEEASDGAMVDVDAMLDTIRKRKNKK